MKPGTRAKYVVNGTETLVSLVRRLRFGWIVLSLSGTNQGHEFMANPFYLYPVR